MHLYLGLNSDENTCGYATAGSVMPERSGGCCLFLVNLDNHVKRTNNQDRHAAARYKRNLKQNDDRTRKVRELACLGLQGAERTAVGYCCEIVAARHYNRLVLRRASECSTGLLKDVAALA